MLLLGSGDSGKSTVLKQMRLIRNVPFTQSEVESYRQLVFANLVQGMRYTFDAMEDMDLKLADANRDHADFVLDAPDLKDGQPFPEAYREPFRALWEDKNLRQAVARGNEAALPDKCVINSQLSSLVSVI